MRVRAATSGIQALESGASRTAGHHLHGYRKCHMDGFEACRRLADDPRTRSIPVVFVSTKAQRADQVWARMQGGRELIGKPYTADTVLAALERHAGSPGAMSPPIR